MLTDIEIMSQDPIRIAKYINLDTNTGTDILPAGLDSKQRWLRLFSTMD